MLKPLFVAVISFAILGSARTTLPRTVILDDQCPDQSLSLSSSQLCALTDRGLQKSRSTEQHVLIQNPDAKPSPADQTGSQLTHEPVCTGILPGLEDVLCIYTYANFSNNRGISIFTTPTIHKQFLLTLQDHALNPGVANIAPSTWESKFVPGKGMGARATKKLNYGDHISSYTPVLLLYMEQSLTSIDREHYLRIGIDRLPPTTRDMYMDLTRIYDDDRVPVQDIIKANSFEMIVGGVMHLAIFPEDSRFNHDCAPNTMYYMDPLRLTHVLHVTREIKQGEELSIAYINPFDTSKYRHYHLKSSFHFMCGCERCADPEKSDGELAEIKLIHGLMQAWDYREDNLPETLSTKYSPSKYYDHPVTNAAERSIALHKQVGLEGFIDTPYGLAAFAYSSVGQAEVGRMYAERALRGVKMRLGPSGGPNGPLFEEFLRDGPEKHWSWNRRRAVETENV